MAWIGILWPTFALVALVFAVWLTMAVVRTRHARRHPPTAADFASGTARRDYFEPVALPSDNLANLFEMPVLYFALVPLLMVTRQADHLQVLLAWAFVALRALHSIVHIRRIGVPLRGAVYSLSCLVLAAMWIAFALDIADASARLAAVA